MYACVNRQAMSKKMKFSVRPLTRLEAKILSCNSCASDCMREKYQHLNGVDVSCQLGMPTAILHALLPLPHLVICVIFFSLETDC